MATKKTTSRRTLSAAVDKIAAGKGTAKCLNCGASFEPAPSAKWREHACYCGFRTTIDPSGKLAPQTEPLPE